MVNPWTPALFVVLVLVKVTPWILQIVVGFDVRARPAIVSIAGRLLQQRLQALLLRKREHIHAVPIDGLLEHLNLGSGRFAKCITTGAADEHGGHRAQNPQNHEYQHDFHQGQSGTSTSYITPFHFLLHFGSLNRAAHFQDWE